MHIRAARTRDFESIAAIYGHAVLTDVATFEVAAPDRDGMIGRWQKLKQKGFPYLVAEDGDAIVGYAYCSPYHIRPAYELTVENSVYVDDHCHGRGIGRALMVELIAEAERRGFRQMIAIVGDTGKIASTGLHEALGFNNVGRLRSVGYKHGRWIDTILMQRDLGNGNRTPPGS